ncbi:hypothetical protein AHAS_Ahas19G0086000 [Arachis hypogaea]
MVFLLFYINYPSLDYFHIFLHLILVYLLKMASKYAIVILGILALVVIVPSKIIARDFFETFSNYEAGDPFTHYCMLFTYSHIFLIIDLYLSAI